MSIINITGIYGNGSYMNLDVQSQLTSDTSTVLNGSTAIYGTCTINDVSVMDTINSIQTINTESILSDISKNKVDISSNTANIITMKNDI